MFRTSLIVCASLIFGITAKPLNKLPDKTIQEAVMSIDDNGKLSLAVEVEPPEDMDGIQHEIDPSMRIWKNMRGTEQDKKNLKAEEDLDELYHPSVGDLQGRIQTLDVLAVANVKAAQVAMQRDDNMKYKQKAEEDKDDIDHPVLMEVSPEEPEQDWGGVKAREELARVHLKPEEDMDDLYHKDQVIPVFYHGDTRAVYPVNFPSQRKHSEPEEDLDELYHR